MGWLGRDLRLAPGEGRQGERVRLRGRVFAIPPGSKWGEGGLLG